MCVYMYVYVCKPLYADLSARGYQYILYALLNFIEAELSVSVGSNASCLVRH